MKALLTGITGNLGYEISLALAQRGVTLIPCVRPGKTGILFSHPTKFQQIVEYDLTEAADIEFSDKVDCIIHCAGVVHFRDVGNKNEQMMRKVLALAKKLKVPVHFISTAFVYRPHEDGRSFNNSYEQDKFNAEQLLIKSGVPYGIFRPSVLTGHSRTGEIRNFSGFYLIVRAFISAIRAAKAKNQVLRFPRMLGESNMVPVDQAAESIGNAIQRNQLEILYVTNPVPPRSEWVLDETLDFFNIRDSFKIIDISFQEFGNLNLTEEEAALYRFSGHFSAYWSTEYAFPPSICTRNLIDHDYLVKALTFFRDSEHFSHGQKTH